MTSSGNPAPEWSSGRRRWTALAGVWIVYATFGATASSLAPLLTKIRADLRVGNAALGLILGAWPLTHLVSAIPCGLLLDRIGPRAGLFLASLVIAASAALRGVAGGEVALLAAVALFGMGAPLVSVGAPKLIAACFEGPARATAMGVYITGPSVGAIATLSLTASHLLPLAGDWRGVMMLHAAAALAAGGLWLAAAAAARLTRVEVNAAEGGLRAVGTVLRAPAVGIVLGMGAAIFFVNHALNNWLPELLRAKGLDAEAAGDWAALPTLVGLAAALFVPRLATPDRRLAVLTATVAAALVGSLLLHAPPGGALLAGLALLGVARGAMNTIALLMLVESPAVPAARMGTASGLFFAAAEFGGVLGPLSFGVMLQATGGFGAPIAAVSAAGLLLLVLCAMMRRAGRGAPRTPPGRRP